MKMWNGVLKATDNMEVKEVIKVLVRYLVACLVVSWRFLSGDYGLLYLTQKVFANMRRVGKGFSRVDTPLFEGMLVPQQVQVDIYAAAEDEDVAEPTPPTPATTPPTQQELIPSTSQDKIAQAFEITRLKQRVRKLEKKTKLKASRLTRLRKVRTAQRVKSSADTVMDDQEDASKQGEIDEIDADEDVTLEEVAAKVTKNANVQGRLEESQAQVYHLDLNHAQKVLTSAPRRRKGVVIRDPEETATPSVIVHSEPKSKDKGKGILVEEPKPLKKQAQIEQDDAYARELEAELNANINWNEVIKQFKRKEKQDNIVMRYQALKRKPHTEAQARKNMMVYLKNMAGFKMDFFKGMTYDGIRPIFEKHFNFIVAFLEKGEKKLEEEESKVPVVNYQIHTEHNKPYYKIIRADGTHQLFLSFISLLRNFDIEDLKMLWKIVQERFASLEPKNFSDDFLLNTLKTMFEKPNVKAHIWKNRRGSYGLAKVKSWKFTSSHSQLLR
nr:hypothetical protein [Tanacetum cinerariifolium]